jgi:hypothetical protein
VFRTLVRIDLLTGLPHLVGGGRASIPLLELGRAALAAPLALRGLGQPSLAVRRAPGIEKTAEGYDSVRLN